MIRQIPFTGGVLKSTIDTTLKPVILTRDQLKEYAKQLAHIHEIGDTNSRLYRSILNNLYANDKSLSNTYKTLSLGLVNGKLLLPSSTEWLLDNYYVISEQIQTVKKDLSLSFYKTLPKLKNGPFKDYPRIYSIALELLTHSDNRLDADILADFILSYESVAPLTSAELWALPIMLRLVWIENLRSLMDKALETFQKRQQASDLAHKFANSIDIEKNENFDIARILHSKANPDAIFLIWLLRSLRDKEHVAPLIHWLELYIEQEDINIEEIVKVENQRQAANRVSAGNIITSMRLVSSLDLSVFFEKVSLVERILEQDPMALYSQIDFASRDRYRHTVENLSRYSTYNEQEVARRAIKLAGNASGNERHVGYYLIDKGLAELKKSIGYAPYGKQKIRDFISSRPAIFYLFGNTILMVAGASLLAFFLASYGISPFWSLLSIIPFSVLSLGIINKIITTLFPAVTPPKMEFKDGIPDKYKTAVVVPCMVGTSEDLHGLAEALEKRYLTNKEKNLFFALLSDFPDSPLEKAPHEAKLLQEMKKVIDDLNNKYSNGLNDIFYIFHRKRKYNNIEKVWMGWERKRGKLEEFNKFIVEGNIDNYELIVGDLEKIRQAIYVITLDADTQMPLNTALKLVGAMAHPLNTPQIDPRLNRVTAGFGIIQPRVDILAPSAVKSFFTRIFATDAGLDPYHSVVSNIYQDFFGSALYIGKGIYNVQAFYKCLGNRFPDNRLLSHDLLEGDYLRVGFTSDIELLEDFPSAYSSFSKRQHRWVRGDWQTLPWLFSRDLGGQEKWKIMDNLRRSLVAPFGFAMLLFGWFAIPQIAFWWTLGVLAVIFFPLIETLFGYFQAKLPGEDLKSFLVATFEDISRLSVRAFVSFSFLAYEAERNLDAIFKAITRTVFKRKGILEWNTQAAVEKKLGENANMYSGIIAGLLVSVLWFRVGFSHSVSPLLLALAWIISPLIANYISKPDVKKVQHLDESQNFQLKITALRIWRFFDEFANSENNYLPPDNLQVSPGPILARRTSPTNIGFGLLAAVSAYDFGFISKSELFTRLTETINTLDKLEKYNGHFYNWYQTDSLAPLRPAYVSTVDSGNMATSLIAIKQACIDISQAKLNNNHESVIRAACTAWIRDWEDFSKTVTAQFPLRVGPPIEHKKLHHIIKKVVVKIESARTETDQDKLKLIFKEIEQYENKAFDFVGNDLIKTVAYWRQYVSKFVFQKEGGEEISDGEWLKLSSRASKIALGMNFEFLYNTERKVFSIGFNTAENKADDSYYNLLATEARLASFIAIALGQISAEHWFSLGRPLTKVHGKTALLSWGGTLFEYLMPEILMKSFENTLIWQSNMQVIERQIEYAKVKKIPWGVSESGFFAFDYQYNYQYQQFGIPDLSLKTEMSENLVVAPYATLLALPFRASSAYQNLLQLESLDVKGTYGYYEAVDFTPSRIPKNQRVGIVKSYMAHHQGMGLVSLNNYFHENIMQTRFHRDSLVLGTELLLGEKIPAHIPKVEMQEEVVTYSREILTSESIVDTTAGKTDSLRTTILSNSEYSVVVSNTGTGSSTWKDLDITRNSLDTTDNNWGWFCFIKDIGNNQIWSSTFQPYLKKPEKYRTQFSHFKAEFERLDNGIETKSTVVVAMDSNVEIREISITNKNKFVKKLELTDYAEVVGLKHKADTSHPAFGKLSVESEYDSVRQSLAFKRKPRNLEEKELWIWHTVRGSGERITVTEYETDRNVFLGRGHTILNARAFDSSLGKNVGATLDPIMSLRTKITLKPNENLKLHFITGVSDSRTQAENTIDKFSDPGEVDRSFNLSEIHSQIELRHLGISSDEARLFQKLGSKIIYPDRYFRAPGEIIEKNTKSQSGLFPYGISGDLPIVLTKIHSSEGLILIKQLLLAHELLRMKRVYFDLVILNEQPSTYSGDLKEAIQSLIDTSLSRPLVDKLGGIHVRDSEYLSVTDKILFDTTARVILDSKLGALEDIFELVPKSAYKQKIYELPFDSKKMKPNKKDKPELNNSLNKWGGFNESGSEYLVNINAGESLPLPWSNVISNPTFGTLVTNGGLGYTWANNSQLNRLTTWSNDTVTEKPGEILYLKESTNWWSTTPLPTNIPCQYETSHGWGYSTYKGIANGIAHESTVWVDHEDPVKIILLKVKNNGKKTRTIKPIYFAELAMGDNRERNQFFIVTNKDAYTGALTARNSYSDTFPESITFLQVTSDFEFSTDRSEFLGRGGSWTNPNYFSNPNSKLSGSVGAGLDPAIIAETEIVLKPTEEKQIAFVLGQAGNYSEFSSLAKKYKQPNLIQKSFEISKEKYHQRLTKITINTPDKYLNTLSNGWLPYQVLSGRFWGRSSFYQSGGAFGFRDQLQDVLALLYSDPQIAREHILYCSEHQFIQGDVMHWWHPYTNRGVRTRMTDDFLWLVYAVQQYVSITSDTGILDEKTSFMDMTSLTEYENERYDEAVVTHEKATLYSHCIRALENGMKTGKHGLPLIGTGDWNDGLNNVGIEGKGESVWLAWFQYDVYTSFSKICKERGDKHNAIRYSRYAKLIRRSAEKNAWDGDWYKRAYFDNGTPLGSHENIEAIIDSISQTWAVISGGADVSRQTQALESVENHLVRNEDQLILLLTPPFDISTPFPGYIGGYLPGIRENGAQYTHAAVWLPLAYTKVGNGDRAVELLDMLNPISHTNSNERLDTYKGEPYVLAGDVYSHPQHMGRVGWSWYTGAASWYYRIVIENILGITLRGHFLSLNPCIPKSWKTFNVKYVWKETEYNIEFENPEGISTGVVSVQLDKKPKKNKIIRLVNDKKKHDILIVMGKE